MANYCTQCGAPIPDTALKCEYCGAANPKATQAQPQATYQQPYQPQPQVVYVQQPVNTERLNWPVKSKIIAAILALLLGGLGVHKFYLGQTGLGILYLIFCWTFIPGILAFIDAIVLFCSSDENFEIKYKCRTK